MITIKKYLVTGGAGFIGSNFIHYLLNKYTDILIVNLDKLPIYSDGMQIRDWLHVEDHFKAIDMVLHHGTVGEVYNIGGHNEFANMFIVNKIINIMHDQLYGDEINSGSIEHVADRLGHDRRYGIDPTKIKNELGWYPETCFEEGIQRTIDWYLENEKWMENIISGEYQRLQ